jgi:hypothetical protein
MGNKPKRRNSPTRGPWPSIELFLAAVLVAKLGSLIHQLTS